MAAEERGNVTPVPVVGVGASAGGLDALSRLLAALPPDAGMAYLLVEHLDPNHPSRLTDLLAKATRMAVSEATEGAEVRADHVYVIPPNMDMAIERGRLKLTPRPETRALHLPLDHLLRSLARDQEGRAVAVVLSGTGADGTVGVAEIKAAGGVTFAQDEESAKHAGMPRSAAKSGYVDFVLSPEAIARELVRLRRHPYLGGTGSAESRGEEPSEDDQDLRKILAVVHSTAGVDFTQYRDTTIRRRVMRRMMLHTERSLAGYLRLLQTDGAEVHALCRDLLIHVTGFFRDPEVFEALKTTVFPSIIDHKPVGHPIRVWVPGCSTGQEAYSLAIALLEFLDGIAPRFPIQIFASDISDGVALERARAGVYPESIEAEVSPERLGRFFEKAEHAYRIDRAVRDMCVFAHQNVASDPPFSHVDLISCRNLLIYMAPELQRRVLPTFHRTHKIYAKKVASVRFYPHFVAGDHPAGQRPVRSYSPGPPSPDFVREADRLLLGRYAPPGVIVHENLNVLQFRGRTGRFLEAPPGEPTANVLKLAREGLFLELRSALAEAARQNAPVRRQGVRVWERGQSRDIDLEVVPVQPPGAAERCFLVLFEELAPGAERQSDSVTVPAEGAADQDGPATKARSGASRLGTLGAEREVLRLQQELAATKEYLQSLLEQQDATNEELRSAHEEVLSSNEELQSANEELETAKEELQSTNEELTTVNEQLQVRNVELTRVNNDLTNILTSSAIPLVVLGPDLRIKRFTPAATNILSLLPTDVGRPIGDIRSRLDMPDLAALVGSVMESLQVYEREMQDRDGRWHLLRIYPYRTADRAADGCVVVLLDIDQVRRAQAELERQATQLRQQASLMELSQDAIIVSDAEGRVVFWNRGAADMYGWSVEETRGQLLHAQLGTAASGPGDERETELDRANRWDGELYQARRDGTPILVHSRQVVIRDETGARLAVLAINRDLTERDRARRLLQAQAEELRVTNERKDEFLAMLAHELRNPLAALRHATEVLRRTEGDRPTLERALDVLERQGHQLGRIVDDLLDVSRISHGKIVLHRDTLDAAAMVRMAVEMSRSQIEGRGHELTISAPSEPQWVEADATRLTEVVANLLDNAAKFTEPGGRIWLAVEPQRVEGVDWVAIRVRDSGVGITPDMLARIFEMFTQADRSLERLRGGLGLGLTLTRSIVEMHGGTVHAESAGLGQGSEFVVRLPRSPRAAAAAGAGPAAQPPSPSPRPRRILVVDDNEDSVTMLRTLLELHGHQVRVVLDGPSGLTAARDLRPDIALLDIGLPGMNGYELAQRIRQEPGLEHVVLVAQTGYGQPADRERAREAGFTHHLLKPVDVQALLALLAELDRSRD
jgi:two-component system CheB/CheR fusion protein